MQDIKTKKEKGPSLTDEQALAINTRDRTLLISAAAGSGKTFTLTKRIIDSILDTDNPRDIGRMLIVTFTNSAVADLRRKISAALRDAAREHLEGDERSRAIGALLEEQYLRVKDARIITINSFCNDILRACAERVGITPTYRIAEPAEAALIARDIAEGLVNAAFSGELDDVCTKEEFTLMTEGLTSIRDERGITSVLLYIYDRLSSEEKGLDTLAELLDEYNLGDKGFCGSRFFGFIRDELKEYCEGARCTLNYYMRELMAEGGSERTVDTLASDIDAIHTLEGPDTYGGIRATLESFKFKTIAQSGSLLYTEIRTARTKIKSHLSSIYKSFFELPEENFAVLYPTVYKNGTVIYKFLKKFDEVFLAEKRRRGIVEFRDAERYAYAALIDENKNPTDIALALREKYTDIYIDEYQDVNALQGRIFEAISRDDNCFMVGDIKQSIYGFRSAKPDFFRRKKTSFKKLAPGDGDAAPSTLFMSSNFRCDKPVIDYTNTVFDALFGALGESIGYEYGDRLVFAKRYGDCEVPTGHIPEIHLVEKPAVKDEPDGDAAAEAQEKPSESDKLEAELLSAAEHSAELVADKIASLVGKERLASGELIKPSDIAILMRSVKRFGSVYKSAIERRGIECEIAEKTDFFLNEEVLLTLSLLSAIDNPRKDVYLSAIMVSPLFGFTFDELYKIRLDSQGVPLYDSLLSYTESHPDFEKGVKLISDLERYRTLAEGMSIDAFISLIYKETGLVGLASVNGGRENLVLLHGYARAYERSSFKGLYSFISYVNEIIENRGAFKAADSGESAECTKVQIITCHSSKGLEFPVVFLAEASSQLKSSPRDEARFVALACDFGFSVGVSDESGLATLTDPTEAIIRKYIERREYDEALRVLYVTLTRARERLYIFGSVKDIDASIMLAHEKASRTDLYTLRNLGSFLEMLLVCGRGARIVKHYYTASSEQEGADDGRERATDATDTDTVSKDELIRRFGYTYHMPSRLGIPEKLSVSVLKPSALDGSDEPDELIPTPHSEDECEPIIPIFLGGTDENLAAQRGTATHVFMQFFDVKALGVVGAEAELNRLIQNRFISKSDGALVRLNEIERFAKTDLYAKMRDARRLYRELRFNTVLAASRFTEDKQRAAELGDETLLVQGVIDCVIEDGDGRLHLIDYKTDRVPRELLSDADAADKMLLDRHRMQLLYYREAVTEMFGKPPSTVGIYSLMLGRTIYLDT